MEHRGAVASSHCPAPAKWINMINLSLHTSSHTSLWPPPPQVLLFCSSQPPGRCWHPLSFWSSVKSSSLKNPLWPGDPGCPRAAGAMTADPLWHTQVWVPESVPRCCGPGCWSSVVLFPASGSSACPALASLCGRGHPVGCILQLLRCRRLRCRQSLGTSDWTNASGAWGSALHQIPSSPTWTSSSGFGDVWRRYGLLNPQKHGDQRSEELWSQSPLSTVSLCWSVTSSLISWPPPSSLYRSSVVLLVEMKSGPLQLLFPWQRLQPSLQVYLAVFLPLSFPLALLLFLSAAAAAAAGAELMHMHDPHTRPITSPVLLSLSSLSLIPCASDGLSAHTTTGRGRERERAKERVRQRQRVRVMKINV